MTDEKFELIAPQSECVSPEGHRPMEFVSSCSRIPVRAACACCGDSFAIIALPRAARVLTSN